PPRILLFPYTRSSDLVQFPDAEAPEPPAEPERRPARPPARRGRNKNKSILGPALVMGATVVLVGAVVVGCVIFLVKALNEDEKKDRKSKRLNSSNDQI